MFQLGFDTEAFGLVFASDYKTKVISGEDGRETQATVERFLKKVVSSCMDLSFTKEKMLKEFLFTDAEITYVTGSVLRLLFLGEKNALCRITHYGWQGCSKNENVKSPLKNDPPVN